MYLQWKVGDPCWAVWSRNNQLYKASILEVDRMKKVCMVRYDEYDVDEERPWILLCPVYDRRLSHDDRYHPNGQSHGNIQVPVYLLAVKPLCLYGKLN